MHKYIKTAYSSSDFKDLSGGIGQRGNASVALSLCDGKLHHHHRGQCIIYLRRQGIRPIGYYGW